MSLELNLRKRKSVVNSNTTSLISSSESAMEETSYKSRQKLLIKACEDWVAEYGNQRCDRKSGRPRLARMAIDCFWSLFPP